MADLFDDDNPRVLALPDAELVLHTGVVPAGEAGELQQQLIRCTPWRAEEITLWGKPRLQPRLVAWYGDSDCRYSYSGISLQPLPWTDLLTDLRRKVETLCAHRFNSVLLNYYRDQRDSMGMHSDDEPELGPEPVIASLSLGETRTLVLKHRRRHDLGTVRLPLPGGSVLVMRGATQRGWKHGIGKERKPCGPRVNLTFRSILRGA